MERDVTYIQDVQDAYSSMANLTMLIIDQEGSAVTKLSVQDEFAKMNFYKWGFKRDFENILQPLKTIKKPIILDSNCGAKVIVSPIFMNNKLVYYILAGYLIESSSRKFVFQYMEENKGNMVEFLEAFRMLPELTEKEIKAKLELVRKFTNIVATYLSLTEENNRNAKVLVNLSTSLEQIRQDGVAASSTINEYLPNNCLDFSGLALENKEVKESFIVDFMQGKNTEHLNGHSFSIGEGFLGHTFAIEKFQFWKDVSLDPRTFLFIDKGMKLKSLFCMPIYDNNVIKGIYFGGSYHNELDENLISNYAKLQSEILSALLTTKTLKTNLQNHLMKLSTFNEIFKVITSVKDIKRVLYILVDISINLIRGPFTCIVGKPDNGHSKVEIVSRGLSNEEINLYGTDVAERYFSKRVDDSEWKTAIHNKTIWGTKVIEFPLLFNNHLYGVLCVGVPPKSEMEGYESFLSSLSVAGSISMHLHEKEKHKSGSEDKIEMLQKIMEQINPAKHGQLVKMKQLVEGFCKLFYKGDISFLSRASSLLEFDVSFLKTLIEDEALIRTIRNCRQRLQNKEVTESHSESEILALIYLYVQHEEDINIVAGLPNIAEEIKDQFIEYLNQENIMESEISISFTTKDYNLSLESDGANFFKTEMNLSAREIDVLNLVLKGFSNIEIASELFISDHTVKNHMTKILQKLGVSDRSQAIAKVYKMGYSPKED